MSCTLSHLLTSISLRVTLFRWLIRQIYSCSCSLLRYQICPKGAEKRLYLDSSMQTVTVYLYVNEGKQRQVSCTRLPAQDTPLRVCVCEYVCVHVCVWMRAKRTRRNLRQHLHVCVRERERESERKRENEREREQGRKDLGYN